MPRFLAALVLVLATAAAALAQSAGDEIARLAPRWEEVSARIEAQIANPAIASDVLEGLRAEAVAVRDEARRLRDAAAEAVAPLRAQLDALGPPPAEGATEAPEIAEQRRQLSEAIARAEVPVKTAEAALRRAEAIISSIDSTLRGRFRDELLTLGPSPLSPGAWQAAAGDLMRRTQLELRDAMAGASRAGSALWVAAALAALGLALLIAVRGAVTRWFRARLARAMHGGRGGGLRGLLDGLGLMISAALIPGLGLVLIVLAVRTSGIINGAAAPLIRDMGWLAIAMIGAYWLSETLFGPDVPARGLFPMGPDAARRARRATLVLGVVLGLDLMLIRGESAAWRSIESLSVISFVLIVLGSLSLWRLAGAIGAEVPAEARDDCEEEEGETGEAIGRAVRRLVVQAARLVAIVAPVLAAVGLNAAARFLLYPTLISGALFGACVVLVALVDEAVEAALRDSSGPSRLNGRLRLIPVLFGFVLGILALPLLALIWGARESDLDGIRAMLVEGISIGETRISPVDFIVFVVIFSAGYLLTRLLQGLLRVAVLPQTSLDTGGQKAVASIVGYLGIVLAALAAISATGLDLSNLAIVAGALSVGIGFGLQTVVSNFVSGLILLIERPIKEGDWVKVGEVEGTVRRIAVRATEIQTFDRAVVTVPNADFITSTVMNRTHRSTTGRIILKVGVAYGTDTRRVERILSEVARGCDLLLPRPEPKVVFRGFGADSLDFELFCYLRDVTTTLDATTFLNHAIAERFREEGIEIPFAQRDIHLRDLDRIAALMRELRDGGEGGRTAQGRPAAGDEGARV
ncbi:MAG: mechanosensitive ion channel protein MscS [Paracoccaceae bacterium]|nr:MAG: mechanosensitive ion channel protein MscS [Paracoccaceae bacterium]